MVEDLLVLWFVASILLCPFIGAAIGRGDD